MGVIMVREGEWPVDHIIQLEDQDDLGPVIKLMQMGAAAARRSLARAEPPQEESVVPAKRAKTVKKPLMKEAPVRRSATVEPTVQHPSDEEHSSISQLAEKWHRGYETVRRWVLKEPGVFKTNGGTGQRAHYSISKSMAQRIYNKHST
jgi:hypothetical protein